MGLLTLLAVGTRFERLARFSLFAFDTCIITALLAFGPLSSGDDIPQNLVFITARVQYYYIVISAAVLTLSPALVLWTGGWAVFGLGGATTWILSGMSSVLTLRDLPPSPLRAAFFETVLDPSFLGLSMRFQEGLILAVVTSIAAWAVHRARNVVGAHAKAEAGRRRVKSLFGRYVPASVVTELIDEGHLEPQMLEASLLFADIEGFTGIAETLTPSALVDLLNELFSAVTTVIDDHGGVVVNYIGDAVIASFNAPLPVEDHARQAIEAARKMLAVVSRQQFHGISIRLRIGIATGRVAAGTVGSGQRQTYTLYGDAVNLSQRLEVLNKEYGTQCLVCGTTARLAGTSSQCLEPIGTVPIRSREQPLEVFRLVQPA
jgi:adenylate cyclase